MAVGCCQGLLEQVGQVLEMAMPDSPPLLTLVLQGPFPQAVLEEHCSLPAAHPCLCHCLALTLYFGHIGALVTHMKEEWDQYSPFVAVPPLVILHHWLQLVSEEAEGELWQLAALLVGRKRDKLWKQQLPAHCDGG